MVVLESLELQTIWLRDRYKYNELTMFGAIDFGNRSFNDAVQIQDT